MLTVLGGIAEFERNLILQQTNERRVRAMAEGTRFGHKPKLTKHQARQVLKRVRSWRADARDCTLHNVDHSTISRLKARHAAGESFFLVCGRFHFKVSASDGIEEAAEPTNELSSIFVRSTSALPKRGLLTHRPT